MPPVLMRKSIVSSPAWSNTQRSTGKPSSLMISNTRGVTVGPCGARRMGVCRITGRSCSLARRRCSRNSHSSNSVPQSRPISPMATTRSWARNSGMRSRHFSASARFTPKNGTEREVNAS